MGPDLIALIAFLAIVLLTLGLAGATFGRRRPDDDEEDGGLRGASDTLWAPGAFEEEPAPGLRRRQPRGPGWVPRLLAGFIPQLPIEARRLEQELGHAGYYRKSARVEFLALRNLLVLAVLIVFGMMALSAADESDTALQILLIGAVVAAIVYSVPRLYLQSVGRARLRRIQRSLPDTLDLIAMCMAGGLSLQEALERVARDIRKTHPDMATELRIVRRHTELGSLEQAFRQLANRLDLPELKAMSAMIVQSERLGTNLVAPLDTFANDLRRDRRQRANAQSSSAAVRMMIPMVLCLLPATILLLWGPALLELRDFWRREQGPGGALSIPQGFGEGIVPPGMNAQDSATFGGAAPASTPVAP